jgi:hypothetical protein
MTVTELARRIEKSRYAVYRAVKEPWRYPVTYRRILDTLERRAA